MVSLINGFVFPSFAIYISFCIALRTWVYNVSPSWSWWSSRIVQTIQTYHRCHLRAILPAVMIKQQHLLVFLLTHQYMDETLTRWPSVIVSRVPLIDRYIDEFGCKATLFLFVANFTYSLTATTMRCYWPMGNT